MNLGPSTMPLFYGVCNIHYACFAMLEASRVLQESPQSQKVKLQDTLEIPGTLVHPMCPLSETLPFLVSVNSTIVNVHDTIHNFAGFHLLPMYDR